jgi:4-hydroxy-tetrahydrodipicolinate reductase
MTQPIRLLIHGASGRMGNALLRLAAEDPRFIVVAAVSRSGANIAGAGIPALNAKGLAASPDFDIAIDFSLPEAFDALLSVCVDRGAALVSGTTGLDERQRTLLSVAAQSIPVLWASNFSLGVVVLEELVRRAASALRQWQVDITETHHVHKKDAPSGTALTLARAAQQVRGAAPAIRSLREGEVVGEHVVRFSGPGESVELTHSATDRDIFARGALEAAARLHGRSPGNWALGQLVFPPAGAD